MQSLGVLGDGSGIYNSTFSNNLWHVTNPDYVIGPGFLISSNTEPFVFTAGVNDSLTLTWSGFVSDAQTITIPAGTYTALQLVGYLNSQLRHGQASIYTYNSGSGGTPRVLLSADTMASGRFRVASSGTAGTNISFYAGWASNNVAPLAFKLSVAESSTAGGINTGPFTMDHNAFIVPDELSPALVSSAGVWTGGTATNTALIDGFKFTSNVMNPSIYAFHGVWPSMADQLAHDTVANGDTIFANNSIPVGPSAQFSVGNCTGGRICTGNTLTQTTTNDKYLAGSLKAAPGSAFSRAGYDGRDLGPDQDHLALINNLTVVPGKGSATFEYDLTAVNQDVPCVLEVSMDHNLIDDLAPYSVVVPLDPTLFLHPDTDRRTNPKLLSPITVGLHHTFVVGQPGSVADDNDGTVRSLALASATQHFYRLMCGGDTRWGKFTTANENDSLNNTTATRVSIKVQAPAGTTTARVSYGATRALGNTIDGILDGAGNVEFLIPVMPGVTTYYQISFIGATTTVLPIAII